MPRFDVYRNPDEPGYVLDCQTDFLSELSTRLVVPLMPPDMAPSPISRLNPTFTISGARHVMVTQFAAAMPSNLLGPAVASLKAEDIVISNALDMLLVGF